jgi:probable F420-dependent oxidoreductase
MRIGILAPVVTQLPDATASWERTATIEDLARVASVADALGFAHVTCSEHVAVPTDVATVRGSMYWDPLPTFGFLAARTTRIRFATHVLVLGYHHPLALAKRYATLDVVTGGRLVLGVGVGSLREEFDLLGAPFEDRGRRADDALRVLRAAFANRLPAYNGDHYRFEDFIVEPQPLQRHVPVWIGGRTMASLRRAIELGDGWAPFALEVADYVRMLTRVERPDGFALVLPIEGLVDPLGNPTALTNGLQELRTAGATHANVRIRSTSVEHYVEQLHALRELGGALGAEFDDERAG